MILMILEVDVDHLHEDDLRSLFVKRRFKRGMNCSNERGTS